MSKEKASGRWLQRIPPELHKQVAAEAKREGVSLNAYVTTILARAIGQREGFSYGKWAGTTLERMARRSPNYSLKTPAEQWAEDKALGILDFDATEGK